MVSTPHQCRNEIETSNTTKYNRISYKNFDEYIKQIKLN